MKTSYIVLFSLILLTGAVWWSLSHKETRPGKRSQTVDGAAIRRSTGDSAQIASSEGRTSTISPPPDAAPLPDPELESVDDTGSSHSRPDEDVIAEDRRKIMDYLAAMKLAEMTRSRIQTLEAQAALHAAMFPGSACPDDLEDVLEGERAELERLESEAGDLAARHRIIDFAGLPPEEQEGVIFLEAPASDPSD